MTNLDTGQGWADSNLMTSWRTYLGAKPDLSVAITNALNSGSWRTCTLTTINYQGTNFCTITQAVGSIFSG